MTREQAREAAKVMLHYADGGEVEFALKGMYLWQPAKTPTFNWEETKFRIKRTLPEVGKWYEIPKGGKLKCIEHTGGKLFFIYEDHTFTILPDTQDFTHFKQVEP